MEKTEQKILITGGAGYIGSHAVRLFLRQGYSVVVVDNLSHGWKENMDILSEHGDLTFVKLDLLDQDALAALFGKYQFSVVLHFAALCSVNESMQNPGLYFDNNVKGTMNLLRAMDIAGCKNLIFSSTCAVYGESLYLPMDEEHPTAPGNPYGESKLMAEQMIKWYGQLRGINYTILRYFNACGAASDGMIGDSKKPSLLLLQNAVRGAMGIEPFSLVCQKVDTPDGTPIRDYIDVEDLADAHYAAFKYLASGKESKLFNLGTGQGWSVKEIIGAVEKYFNITLDHKLGETRAGEYANVYAEAATAIQALDWHPKKTLDDSIASLAKWYGQRPDGYKY
ncbi:MAG: UDP-glucose 4-epimerase GalE [Candidatus Falkowbacteria bacterium]